MATLQDALQCLKPTSWDAVPQSPDELREYVRDIFKQSRLIAESLPDPPPYEFEEYHGGETQTATPAARVVPSSARVGETDPEITLMQKQWGKPIKMGGPKDNPLGVHVWKLSPDGGGGQWFGRRSVHEGLSFTRWRKKLSSEYDETLKVNRKKIEKGETPDKCIRGIGAEEKVETLEVKDEDGSVLGLVTLYHVSAQFPRPTAPRDFVTMIITSEFGLQIGGTKQPGRSWMMVSKPCEHPGVSHKPGYTRGEYESVELIREIPKEGTQSSSARSNKSGKKTDVKPRENGSPDPDAPCPDALAEDDSTWEDGDDEMNPVEWIMVTRSDPGGSIPRWMVDKGTPRSVGADAAKFVDWAVQDDKPQKQDQDPQDDSIEAPPGTELKSGEFADDVDSDGEPSDSDLDSTDTDGQSHHGLIASVTGLLNTGIGRFAPQAFLDYIPHQHEQPHSMPDNIHVLNNDADGTEASKAKSPKLPGAYEEFLPREPDHVSLSSARSELATPAVEGIAHNNLPPAELMAMTKKGKLSSHEKELVKLALRKCEIDAKLETIRSELDKLQIPSQSRPQTPLKGLNDADSENSGILKRAAENRSSTPGSLGTQQSPRGGNGSSDGQSSSQTQKQTPEPPAHIHKAVSHLSQEESKLTKQLRKIEANQLKVASKIETRQKKEAERSEKSRSKSEVESLRHEVRDLKKEVGKLRAERQKWVDLVASLQAENTRLAAKEEGS